MRLKTYYPSIKHPVGYIQTLPARLALSPWVLLGAVFSSEAFVRGLKVYGPLTRDWRDAAHWLVTLPFRLTVGVPVVMGLFMIAEFSLEDDDRAA